MEPTKPSAIPYPEPLLRKGIFAEWLELRIGWTYVSEEISGVKESGSDDLYLGFKIGLTPQEGILPEMALIPQMFVPIGDDAFTADEVLPGLNWIYGWELNDCLSTAGSTQFNRQIDEITLQAYTEWAQSWTVAASLTERLGAYTEWFALLPHSAEHRPPRALLQWWLHRADQQRRAMGHSRRRGAQRVSRRLLCGDGALDAIPVAQHGLHRTGQSGPARHPLGNNLR